MQNNDVVTIGTVPSSAPIIAFDTSLVYNETSFLSETNGLFTILPLTGNYLLHRIGPI